MRPPPAVLLSALALTALVGCSGADRAGSTTTSDAGRPGESSPASTSAAGATNPGKVLPRPVTGTCEPVPERPDGRYVVADAGVVALRLDDGELQVDVSSSDGWATMTAHTPIEAVVTFTRGDEELVLEAERADGRLVVEVCGDVD